MSMTRRLASATVSALLALGIAVGVPGGGAASASTASEVGVIEVPRNSPPVVNLARVFRCGDVFSIVLYENPTTGYRWTSAISPGAERTVALLDTSYVQDPAPPGMVGVGGTRYFRFAAGHPGQATITLLYQRSWEPQPIQRVTLDVQVQPGM